MSNKGKWDSHYRNAPSYFVAYGESLAYILGAQALDAAGCETVEDWGCGLGWFKVQLGIVNPNIEYVGLDGSCSPHADHVVDLIKHSSKVDGIFMRGVLEHNYDWPALLNNALQSFTKRMVLVTFTPFADGEHDWKELRYEDEYDVPTLSLNRAVLDDYLASFDVTEETIVSPNTAYGSETIFVIDR